jgi:hypothetical protein
MQELPKREDLLRKLSDFTYNTEYNLSLIVIHNSIAKQYDTAVTAVFTFHL